MIFLILISSIIIYSKIIKNDYLQILKIHKFLDLSYHKKIKNRLKIGTFSFYLENGGRSRITSFLFNYLSTIAIFDLYLFTIKIKNKNEYLFNKNITRILINSYTTKNLIKKIRKKRIDVFIYQFSDYNEINIFNNLKKIKIIFYQHQSLFYWIYANYTNYKYLYKVYQKSKNIISLIHLENDYIFKKWGIKTILMNNFITYDFNNSFPSNLISKNILMIGRANDKFKRFKLGIRSMEYIVTEIPFAQMNIISNLTEINFLRNLINNLSLKNNIKFFDYTLNPEIYYKNVSLHISTSISESFSLVLSEAKIYGIPSILLGMDYISIKKGGIIIIDNDSIELIAKEAIKIIINYNYRKNMGKEARNSMLKFKNDLLLNRWIKLILSIYSSNDNNYHFKELYKKISEKEALHILQKQIKLFNIRKICSKKIILKDLENINFVEN